MEHYGLHLARVHHEHFGSVARAAAAELRARLARGGFADGSVVDLAAGTGILSHELAQAGFSVLGVDISEGMLSIARAGTSTASFSRDSLWSVELRRSVAVTAVGEAFNYAADPSAGIDRLAQRLADVYRVLVPGGLLLFDVAGPGRSGGAGARRGFWSFEDLHLGLEELEDPGGGQLTRIITLFVPERGLHRRCREEHVLRLYAPDDVERLLRDVGFSVERLPGYRDHPLPAGWQAFAATKAE